MKLAQEKKVQLSYFSNKNNQIKHKCDIYLKSFLLIGMVKWDH